MRDLMKWNIALARLSNFIEKFPSCPDEDHMFQYHEIIGPFEEAGGDRLSQFRITPDRLSPRINGASKSFWHSLCRWEIIEFQSSNWRADRVRHEQVTRKSVTNLAKGHSKCQFDLSSSMKGRESPEQRGDCERLAEELEPWLHTGSYTVGKVFRATRLQLQRDFLANLDLLYPQRCPSRTPGMPQSSWSSATTRGIR
jgi:hypothetical protein